MITTADLHPNQIAQRLTGRDYISWSAITAYQGCSLRYAFRYRVGLPEDTVSASLVFGGAIHRAAEHAYQELLAGNPAPSLDALLEAYREGWQDREGRQILFGKGDDRTSLDALARRMLAAFQASELADPPGTILGIEEELRGALIPGVPDLLARVDLLVDRGDSLTLTDFKTARSRWSEEQVRDSAGQLLLYHELARPIAEGRPVRLEFVVLTKTKTPEVLRYEVPADPVQIARTKRVVEKVWRAIESECFFPAPSAMSCASCPYRDACRTWVG